MTMVVEKHIHEKLDVGIIEGSDFSPWGSSLQHAYFAHQYEVICQIPPIRHLASIPSDRLLYSRPSHATNATTVSSGTVGQFWCCIYFSSISSDGCLLPCQERRK